MKLSNMDRRGLLRWRLSAAIALVVALPAQADSVTDWNAVAAGPAVLARFGGPPQQARAMAIVQIAVHDALNSIDARYQTYNAMPPAGAGASPDAAVAAAAHTALLALIGALPAPPNQAEADARVVAINAINNAYAAAIGPDIDGAEEAGIAAGELAANTIFQQRHAWNGTKWVPNDGAQSPHSPAYLDVLASLGILPTSPGVHQATQTLTGVPTQPQFMGWGNVRPFSINSNSQFRAPPSQLFDLTSQFYADQFNEVKHHGDARVRAANPDSEKTDIARFWPAGGLEWYATYRIILADRDLDRWQHARLFALAGVSTADSLITLFAAKYHYNFWRPVTAIRRADEDGNPATEADPNWLPFMTTPAYPDYPCGSTSNTGAYTETLRNFFGTNAISFEREVQAPPLVLPAPLAPLPAKPIKRKYNSMSIAENEQARARVYEGFHFAEGCYAGIKAANQVADWVYTHQFQPL